MRCVASGALMRGCASGSDIRCGAGATILGASIRCDIGAGLRISIRCGAGATILGASIRCDIGAGLRISIRCGIGAASRVIMRGAGACSAIFMRAAGELQVGAWTRVVSGRDAAGPPYTRFVSCRAPNRVTRGLETCSDSPALLGVWPSRVTRGAGLDCPAIDGAAGTGVVRRISRLAGFGSAVNSVASGRSLTFECLTLRDPASRDGVTVS